MQQNVCRLCGKDTDEAKAINIFEKSACKLLRHIKLISGLLLKYKPYTPSVICNACQLDLKSAINFRNRCLETEKKWKQYKLSANQNISTHIICVRRRGHDLCSIADNALSPAEVLIKVEELSNADDDGVDHLETAANTVADFKHDELSQKLAIELDQNAFSNTLRKKRKLQNQPSKPKEPRAKENLSVFVCEQCGNNIKGKSTFDRHVRKHANIRPYQCKLCTARFLSAGELKGHQVMHTGARNFPCRYCDRTYVNYSGRMRHERTHTNDRPFVCAQCGKAFTSAYILKNHMLIHTGERLFSCTLCARSFQRTSHLSTHYRSNTHRQNLEKSQLQQPQSLAVNEMEASMPLPPSEPMSTSTTDLQALQPTSELFQSTNYGCNTNTID